MKKYLKPQIETLNVVSVENLSNLAGWLEQNPDVDADVQITSYTLVS